MTSYKITGLLAPVEGKQLPIKLRFGRQLCVCEAKKYFKNSHKHEKESYKKYWTAHAVFYFTALAYHSCWWNLEFRCLNWSLVQQKLQLLEPNANAGFLRFNEVLLCLLLQEMFSWETSAPCSATHVRAATSNEKYMNILGFYVQKSSYESFITLDNQGFGMDGVPFNLQKSEIDHLCLTEVQTTVCIYWNRTGARFPILAPLLHQASSNYRWQMCAS